MTGVFIPMAIPCFIFRYVLRQFFFGVWAAGELEVYQKLYDTATNIPPSPSKRISMDFSR